MSAVAAPMPSRLTWWQRVKETFRVVDSWSLIDRAVAMVALLLPIAFAPPFFVPSWTPRMALLLVVLPLGTWLLARATASGDVGSTTLVALCGVCTLSTVLGDAPAWNIRGGFARDSSLVFLVVCIAAWECGRAVSSTARRPIGVCVLASFGASCLVAVFQVLARPDSGLLEMIGGRPSGLMGNPVYFGAVAAGMVAIIAAAVPNLVSRRSWALAAIGLLTGFANLSGSRVAFATVVVVAIGSIVRSKAELRWLLAASFGVGWVWSWAASRAFDASDALGRSSSGLDGRLDVWSYGARAWLDRPVVGHGLGQFRPAVQRYFEQDFVSKHASDVGRQAWPDAHNVVVQFAVVGGSAALLCLAVFLCVAVRSARGPYAWAAAAIAISWTLQPMSLTTAPLAALLLGLAWSVRSHSTATPAESTTRLLLVLGAVLCLTLVGFDNRLHRAVERGDAPEFARWARIGPDDPVVAVTAESLHARFGSSTDALAWATRAAMLEPLDAVTVSDLAVRQYEVGHCVDALATSTRALEFDPFNPYARVVNEVLRSAVAENAVDGAGCVDS